MEAEGYDGIVYANHIEGRGGDSVIPFRPEQIRLPFAAREPDRWFESLFASAEDSCAPFNIDDEWSFVKSEKSTQRTKVAPA